MLHKMKLKEKPFIEIKKGIKTIEYRLYDEKRRKIHIGDIIEFSKLPELNEKIFVEVIDLYIDDSFENLFRRFITNNEEIAKKTRAMREFYSKEQEDMYKVVGIRIKLINKGNLVD